MTPRFSCTAFEQQIMQVSKSAVLSATFVTEHVEHDMLEHYSSGLEINFCDTPFVVFLY